MAEFLKQPPHRPGEDASQVSATVSEILSAVRTEGEAAVRRYSARFDKWDPPSFRVGREEIDRATEGLDPELKRHIDFAATQIRRFAELERGTMHDLEVETMPGVVLGHHHVPVDSVPDGLAFRGKGANGKSWAQQPPSPAGRVVME